MFLGNPLKTFFNHTLGTLKKIKRLKAHKALYDESWRNYLSLNRKKYERS